MLKASAVSMNILQQRRLPIEQSMMIRAWQRPKNSATSPPWLAVEIFKIAKQMKAANQDIIGNPCVKNDKGNLAFSDLEKLMAWKEHYMRLLNEEFEWDESLLVWSDPVEGTSVAPPHPRACHL